MDWEFVIGFIVILIPSIVICLIRDYFKKRKHKKFLEDARTGKLPEVSLEKPENGVINIDEEGFSISIPKKKELVEKTVTWESIEEIRAYKRDLLTVDLICWGFCFPGEEYMIEVNEEMVGFKQLVKTAEKRFEINQDDWWSKVAYPAFATNMTVIWQRK